MALSLTELIVSGVFTRHRDLRMIGRVRPDADLLQAGPTGPRLPQESVEGSRHASGRASESLLTPRYGGDIRGGRAGSGAQAPRRRRQYVLGHGLPPPGQCWPE